MKILRIYINGPVIGELRLMQQKLSPCYVLGKKWLIYHPYSLMGPCLKTQNPISLLATHFSPLFPFLLLFLPSPLKLVEELTF
jgi:hypothetical protein